MADKPDEVSEPGYRIGAVARLTGVAPDTLRIWERRYDVVRTRRGSGSNRQYSRHDIARLTLIKRLVDRGDAISRVANLTLDELEQRLAVHAAPAPQVGLERALRLAVVGANLHTQCTRRKDPMMGIEFQIICDRPEQLPATPSDPPPDVLVIECPTVHDDTVAEIRAAQRRSGAERVVVVYSFAPEPAIRRLEHALVAVVRAPVSLREIADVCRVCAGWVAPRGHDEGMLASALAAPVPARLFSREDLARIEAASTTVNCECPHHLVQIITTLSAFEHYSAECESRTPQDAALHSVLHASTAHARALMEQALAELVRTERVGIDLERD